MRQQQFNFYAQHQANQRRTRQLNALLLVTTLLVMMIIYSCLFSFTDSSYNEQLSYGTNLLNSLKTSEFWAYLILWLIWYLIIQLAVKHSLNNPVEQVMKAEKAKPVTAKLITSNAKVKQLDDVATELAMAYGMKKPTLFLLTKTTELNAFAVGNRDQAGVAITKPLLDCLDREELSGVMGHELAHVLADDSQTTLRFVYYVFSLSCLVSIGWFGLREFSWFSDGDHDRDTLSLKTVLMLGCLALILAGLIGKLCALLLRFAMSRTREYDADAMSAKINMNPHGLIRALQTINQHLAIKDNSKKKRMSDRYQALYLVSNETHWFDDHPSTKERITRLKWM